MLANSLTNIKDFLHAHVCYQVFITPFHLPLEKEYRRFARLACEYLQNERSEVLHFETPRHYVIHRFAQVENPQAKKILITHGWMSRAAYMSRFIRALHQRGFEVYALDFPAHGEARGFQLPWTDAVGVLKQTINDLGPFYGVIGHSFGGSMLLNTLNLSSQYPEWRINVEPERVVLMASPTRMRTPVSQLARQLGLSAKGFYFFRDYFRQQTIDDLKRLDFRHYISRTKTPFLCIHGKDDQAIKPDESIIFCRKYPHASLKLLSGINHINILLDERVEQAVCQFLS